jgi:hypothetical protein
MKHATSEPLSAKKSLGLRTTPNTYGTNAGYIPEQKYVRALLENLHEMSEDGDVVIHWDAIRQRS